MASPPASKKQKVDEKTVYEAFSAATDVVEITREAFDVLCTSRNWALESVTITNCNAKFRSGQLGKSFSKADVDIMENKDDKLFRFGTIFLEGFKLLESYLMDPKSAPLDKQHDFVLSKLLTFLLDKDNEKSLLSVDSVTQECDIAVLYTVHLFSKLCVSPTFTLDQNYPGRSLMKHICVCGCLTDVKDQFGDTTIGNVKTWHGHVDVILGSSFLPVSVIENEPDSPEAKSPVEVNVDTDNLEHPDVTSQVIAETIVFSFTQKSSHPEYSNFLIPNIGLSRNKVIFYFYDSEHDILLKSRAFPITYGNKLNCLAILAIWLVVNYRYLCSGCTKEILNDAKKARFFDHADFLLPVYCNELKVGGLKSEYKFSVEPYEPALLFHTELGKSPQEILAEEFEEKS